MTTTEPVVLRCARCDAPVAADEGPECAACTADAEVAKTFVDLGPRQPGRLTPASTVARSARPGALRRSAWLPIALLGVGGLLGAGGALAASDLDDSAEPRGVAAGTPTPPPPEPVEITAAAPTRVVVPPLGITRCMSYESADVITRCLQDPWHHRSGPGSIAPAAATLAWAAEEAAATDDLATFEHPAVADAIAVLCAALDPAVCRSWWS